MFVITGRNVNETYPEALSMLAEGGMRRPSRAGDTIELVEPCTTLYQRPEERVLFDAQRDANPFFHLFESLWMLDGRRDVAWLERFNPRMREYSDDGEKFHGAYGYRWREWFGRDQLTAAVAELQRDPMSRRVVIQMWDPRADVPSLDFKDLPCNTSVMLSTRSGALDMTVTNRSNDVIWGAYGANVVHFSMLQEVLAGLIGVPMGQYWQVSNNFHAYADVLHTKYPLAEPECPIRYGSQVEARPLFTEGVVAMAWFDDVRQWCRWASGAQADSHEGWLVDAPLFNHDWFTTVAVPMLRAWSCWKAKDWRRAMYRVSQIKASDWQMACHLYLTRRAPK